MLECNFSAKAVLLYATCATHSQFFPALRAFFGVETDTVCVARMASIMHLGVETICGTCNVWCNNTC